MGPYKDRGVDGDFSNSILIWGKFFLSFYVQTL